MLDAFAQDIWLANDAPVSVFGFEYPLRMAVIRLSDRELFIWSPIRLTDELKQAIDQLGRVKYIVAPNSLHHLFVAEWQANYPNAKTYGTSALQKKRKDISFDALLGSEASWSTEIEHILVCGNLITTEAVFFHRASGTVLFADLLQQFPKSHFNGWRRAIAQLDGMVGPNLSVPRKFRLAFANRRSARAAIIEILDWPVEAVVVAHGAPETSQAKIKLKFAFSWLL